MSIFFKFGVESGDPQKVTCDGMDMSLVELKLAIKDLKGIKNVTDFDLQVNSEPSGLFSLIWLDYRWRMVRASLFTQTTPN